MSNNEICLRTSSGEYFPGDTVYGAVYLNICCPSEAKGASVTFKGKESCIYECEIEGKKTHLKSNKVHVDFSNIILYSQEECFSIGRYVFPFKFELPKEIPGTFQYSRKNDSSQWITEVSYHIRVHAIGSESLEAFQQILIYQASKEEFKLNDFGVAKDDKFELPGSIPFMPKTVHLTAKLLRNFTETGSNIELRLIITNPSKFNVTRFRIQLLRYLKLMLRDDTVSCKETKNTEWVGDVLHVAPEDGPHVVQTIAGASDALFVGKSFPAAVCGGLDKIQIPLTEKVADAKENIPPSVTGKHVKNQYGLDISVTFSNNHTQSFNLVIPGVLPRENKEWLSWKAPSWTYQCEVKVSSCLFSVPKSKLHTEAFSNLPTFQVL